MYVTIICYEDILMYIYQYIRLKENDRCCIDSFFCTEMSSSHNFINTFLFSDSHYSKKIYYINISRLSHNASVVRVFTESFLRNL